MTGRNTVNFLNGMNDIEFLSEQHSHYRDGFLALKKLRTAMKRRDKRNDQDAIFRLNKAIREADKAIEGKTEPKPFKSLMQQLRDGELFKK